MIENRPLVPVVEARERSGRGGILGPSTSRRTRWYDLTLECGHIVERTPEYEDRDPSLKGQPRNWHQALPPPERARCDFCPRTEEDDDECG